MEEKFPPRRPIPPRPVFQQDQNLQNKTSEIKEDESNHEGAQNLDKEKKSKREPLTDQSKSIIFGLLGAFALLGGIAVLVVMLVL